MIPIETGLTELEEATVNDLSEAWNNYISLPDNKADTKDFEFHIHALIRIITYRKIARDFPDYWRT